MKSHRAENEARDQATRPRIEVRFVLIENVHLALGRGAADLAEHLNDGWHIAACVADSSGVNIIYTMVRVKPPEPTPPSPGMAVR